MLRQNMSNKAKSIYFVVLAILYLIYTVFVVKHGLHFTNIAGATIVIFLAAYFYIKHIKSR